MQLRLRKAVIDETFRNAFVLECFPEKYTENEAATATANTLKRAPDRKRGGDRKKGLEVTSADFSADEIENDTSVIGLKEKEDTSSDSFDEM